MLSQKIDTHENHSLCKRGDYFRRNVCVVPIRIFEYYVWYVYMYVILIRDIFWKSSDFFLYLLMMRLCVFEYVMT